MENLSLDSETVPDVRVVVLLSELLYCCPKAFTQTLYTVLHISPETTHCVSAPVPTQVAARPFMSSKNTM